MGPLCLSAWNHFLSKPRFNAIPGCAVFTLSVRICDLLRIRYPKQRCFKEKDYDIKQRFHQYKKRLSRPVSVVYPARCPRPARLWTFHIWDCVKKRRASDKFRISRNVLISVSNQQCFRSWFNSLLRICVTSTIFEGPFLPPPHISPFTKRMKLSRWRERNQFTYLPRQACDKTFIFFTSCTVKHYGCLVLFALSYVQQSYFVRFTAVEGTK